ncbi:MAG: hypothetical protein AB8G17_01430 [Gammaproteobacteria bacterium]
MTDPWTKPLIDAWEMALGRARHASGTGLCAMVTVALADPAVLTLTDDVRERSLTPARANTVATNDPT